MVLPEPTVSSSTESGFASPHAAARGETKGMVFGIDYIPELVALSQANLNKQVRNILIELGEKVINLI